MSHVAKFHLSTSLGIRVIVVNALKFKSILDHFKKNCWGSPVQMGACTSALGHSLARVKIWERSTH